MTLSDDHGAALARAERADAAIAELLPGWSHHPAGPTSWAPRLVHDQGASVKVCVRRAGRPARTRPPGWDELEITVALDTPPPRAGARFTRRPAGQVIARHEATTQVMAREDVRAAGLETACARLRAAATATVLAQPWPQDVHDVWLGCAPAAGRGIRFRATGPDSIDVEAHGVPPEIAERLVHVVAHPDATSPTGHALRHVRVLAVSTALLAQSETDTVIDAPTLMGVFDHGA